MTANALVRDALFDTLEAHTATGGALENVVVLRERPYAYADLYGTARGVLDLIWLEPSTATVEVGCLGTTTEHVETVQHPIMIQVDRQPDSWTAELVDARADALLAIVIGIISDASQAGHGPTLGIDLAANNLRYLSCMVQSWDFGQRQLDSGGRQPGHSVQYELTVQHVGAYALAAPVLP